MQQVQLEMRSPLSLNVQLCRTFVVNGGHLLSSGCDSMQTFGRQDDLISVARFIYACLVKAYLGGTYWPIQ